MKNIWFYDSMFGYKKQLAKDILEFIIAKNRPDVSITFYPNLDFLDEELCRLMKAANIYIECGIQTTNEVAYTNLNRKWDRAFLDKKIPMLKKYGLKFKLRPAHPRPAWRRHRGVPGLGRLRLRDPPGHDLHLPLLGPPRNRVLAAPAGVRAPVRW